MAAPVKGWSCFLLGLTRLRERVRGQTRGLSAEGIIKSNTEGLPALSSGLNTAQALRPRFLQTYDVKLQCVTDRRPKTPIYNKSI